MKTAKLIIGIVSMVLTIVLFFQSSAVSFGDAISGAEESSAGVGILLAILLLIAGIVGVATRKSRPSQACGCELV